MQIYTFILLPIQVSYLAQSNFQQELFASDDRYNTVLEDAHFDAVTREQLIAFHKEFILKQYGVFVK